MFESKNHLFWQQRDFLRTSHASAKFTFHIPWTFCSPPSLTQTHLCLFQSTNYPVPSFPTYCKSSVSCSQHSAVFNNASVIVCKKKKKSPSRKKPQFQPFVLELVPYNNISHQSIWTERYTCKKKLIKIYTSPFHYILCTGTKVYIINQGKKERKKKMHWPLELNP